MATTLKTKKALQLIVSIIIAQLAGGICALFTTPAIPTWYAGLVKPALNPPSWIFAPVWTTLFILMGIAAFLIFQKGWQRKEVRFALGVYALQLALNAKWSWLFFGLHNPGLAFIELCFLWFAILWTMLLFYKLSKPAAYLLVPYILWVSFAAYLNYSIWQLN